MQKIIEINCVHSAIQQKHTTLLGRNEDRDRMVLLPISSAILLSWLYFATVTVLEPVESQASIKRVMSVSIGTSYWLQSGGSIPGKSKILFYTHSVQNRPSV
jgi:hypothetical protein